MRTSFGSIKPTEQSSCVLTFGGPDFEIWLDQKLKNNRNDFSNCSRRRECQALLVYFEHEIKAGHKKPSPARRRLSIKSRSIQLLEKQQDVNHKTVENRFSEKFSLPEKACYCLIFTDLRERLRAYQSYSVLEAMDRRNLDPIFVYMFADSIIRFDNRVGGGL